MSDIAITVDGVPVVAPAGSTLLEACRQEGFDVPTLCFLENLTPANTCRICVVEVEGSRALVPACSRQVEPGMVVHTESERVRHTRKMVLELLGSSVDLSLLPLSGLMERYGARPDRFEGGATVEEPATIDNQLFVRDYAKCILCYKCVQACGLDAQNTFAISVAGRGFEARISTEYQVALPDSACVFCGNCFAVCPTGALIPTTEYEMRDGRHLGREFPIGDPDHLSVLRGGVQSRSGGAGQSDPQSVVAARPRRHLRPSVHQGTLWVATRPV